MSFSGYKFEDTIGVDVGNAAIFGTLTIPAEAWGAIIFAHGCGASRRNPRHLDVAKSFHHAGLATLLVELLTPAEEQIDRLTAIHRFDIGLMTERLLASTEWLASNYSQYQFPIGYFATSIGAAAAFKVAARRHDIPAIVSRGGRPDLAGSELSQVEAAVLLLVGGLDRPVMKANLVAYNQLRRACHREVRAVHGATHLFEEKGALEAVSLLATQWFVRYLGAAMAQRRALSQVSCVDRDTSGPMSMKL